MATCTRRLLSSSSTLTALPSSLAGKCALFRRAAQVCVTDATRSVAQVDEHLARLRQLRWSLLQLQAQPTQQQQQQQQQHRHDTPHTRTRLLEHMLRVYADMTRRVSAAHNNNNNNNSRVVEQRLLLEQVQCLVEAKVAGVRLTAQHVRHTLQLPALARVSPQLPLLLLHELTASSASSSSHNHSSNSEATASARHDDGDEEEEARAECAVGLACAGHVVPALPLCSARTFARVLHGVAHSRGWCDAWAMARAVPHAWLLSPSQQQQQQRHDDNDNVSDEAATNGWLHGVLRAAREHVRVGGASEAASVAAWLQQLMHAYKTTTTTTTTTTTDSAVACVPAALVDCYVAVCPTAQWSSAVSAFVQHYDDVARTTTTAAAAQASGNVAMRPCTLPSLARLLTLLQRAAQPRCALQLLYGTDDVAVLQTRARAHVHHHDDDDNHNNEDAAVSSSSSLPPPLTQLTSTYVSARERQSPTLYTHAMTALAAVGVWRGALQLYAALTCSTGLSVVLHDNDSNDKDAQTSARCCCLRANMHTHLGVLRMVLLCTSQQQQQLLQQDEDGDDRGSCIDAAYASCTHALDALLRLSRHSNDSNNNNNNNNSNNNNNNNDDAVVVVTASHPARVELLPLMELYLLWTAQRGDSAAVCRRARAVPPRASRYAHLIALAAAIRGDDAGAVRWCLRAMCSNSDDDSNSNSNRDSRDDDRGAATTAPSCAVQQICLAFAFVANSAAGMRACTDVDDDADDAGNSSNKNDSNDSAEHDDVLDDVCVRHALAAPLRRLLLRRLTRLLAPSQHDTDMLVDLLIHYFVRVQQQQQQQPRSPRKQGECHTPVAVDAARQLPPSPQRVFAQMVALMRDTRPYADGWMVLLSLLAPLTRRHGTSLARAAPALVAAGVSGDIALHFLPP